MVPRGRCPSGGSRSHDNRLALAQRIGATDVINGATVDAFQTIGQVLGGEAVDVFVDNTGQPEVIAKGYQIIKSFWSGSACRGT